MKSSPTNAKFNLYSHYIQSTVMKNLRKLELYQSHCDNML